MIYDAKAVKVACNGVLRAAFNNELPIYGNDTLDGYERPSFFTEILPAPREKTGRDLTRHGFTFKITYFEVEHDEAHCLDVYNTICQAFEPFVLMTAGGKRRRLMVEDIDFDWIDENADMLQVTINFYRVVELGGYTDDHEMMTDVEVEIESEVY